VKQAQQRRTQGGFDIAFSEFRDVVTAAQDARYESAKVVPYSQNIGRMIIEYSLLTMTLVNEDRYEMCQ
jgi:hypothetical protein